MDYEKPDKSEISPEKLAANRRNCEQSTGPKTPEGKRNSCRNARKHGLLSKDIVIPGRENPEQLDGLRAELKEDLQPEGPTEEALVERIAICHWRLRRALRAEVEEIVGDSAKEQMFQPHTAPTPKSLPGIAATTNILRYEVTIHRQATQMMQLLANLQQRRKSIKLPVAQNQDSLEK